MTQSKTLRILDGTNYRVVVDRVHVGGAKYYEVKLQEEVVINDTYVSEYDDVDVRTLADGSSESTLATMVQTMIQNQTPSIAGVYYGSREEEESNGTGN